MQSRRRALELLALAGYDTHDFAKKVIEPLDTRALRARKPGGKAPALPKLKWP